MSFTKPFLILAASTFLFYTTGCESALTGNEGNLLFSYAADDEIQDFNKPIAVGAKLSVHVRQAGTKARVTLNSAESDSIDVLKADTMGKDHFILEGLSEGGALIEVETKLLNGELSTDSVNMRATVPEVLKMKHLCTEDSAASYVVGQKNAWIHYDMEKKNGQAVIGYGYFPIVLSKGLTLDKTSTDQIHYHIDLGDTVGDEEISSTIDDSKLQIHLIEDGKIDGIELDSRARVAKLRVQQTTAVSLQLTSRGEAVCMYTDFTVKSTTPDICELTLHPKKTLAGHSVLAQGKKEGDCIFEITIPKGKAGAGLTKSFTIAVLSFWASPSP